MTFEKLLLKKSLLDLKTDMPYNKLSATESSFQLLQMWFTYLARDQQIKPFKKYMQRLH